MTPITNEEIVGEDVPTIVCPLCRVHKSSLSNASASAVIKTEPQLQDKAETATVSNVEPVKKASKWRAAGIDGKVSPKPRYSLKMNRRLRSNKSKTAVAAGVVVAGVVAGAVAGSVAGSAVEPVTDAIVAVQNVKSGGDKDIKDMQDDGSHGKSGGKAGNGQEEVRSKNDEIGQAVSDNNEADGTGYIPQGTLNANENEEDGCCIKCVYATVMCCDKFSVCRIM